MPPHRPRIFWTPAEFDAIAADIIRRFPQCNFQQASRIDQLTLSLRELLESAKGVLPSNRYRDLSNASPMKVGLLASFARMRGDVVDQQPDGHVRWSAREWYEVAQALERLYPDQRYCSGARMDMLTLAHLNAAAFTLPPGRQRYFTAMTGVRERLLAAWRAGKPDAQQEHATKIFWTKLEWRTLAAELLRLRPELRNDPELASLQLADLTTAQLVLPPERQRQGLHDMRQNRSALHAVMADVVATFPIPASSARIAAPPVPPAAPAPVIPGAEWEAACRPLAELLIRYIGTSLTTQLVAQAPALFDQLAPVLARALAPVLAPLLPPVPAPLVEVPAQRAYPFLPPQRLPAGPPANAAPASRAETAARPEAPPKPVVGVVGVLPAQARSLEASFPNVKLLFVEQNQNGSVIKKLHGCDRVIGMIGFINHPTDGMLNKHFNEGRRENPRYTRVSGGVTSIKRQIEAWLSDGALYQSQARAALRS